MAGKLILCATPIGNLGDAPPRLGEVLAAADAVYAEDTRRTAKLLRHLGVEAALRSYFAGNEESRAAELESRLRQGEAVALVTDAGTPGVSDPGVSAVAAARAAGAAVSIVPGPSAVTAAVAVSGFPAERFAFEGFLPRRGRAQRLAAIASEERTLVLFISPHRLVAELGDLAAAVGDERQVCVVREATKLHEEVWWGTLSEAAQVFAAAKGEITLVVAPGPGPEPDLKAALARVEGLVAGGEHRAQAVRTVAEEMGVPRRLLYETAVRRTGD